MNLQDKLKLEQFVNALSYTNFPVVNISTGKVEMYGGGPGSGRQPYGRKEKVNKEKQKRALASYKPSTRVMQQQATENEKKLAKAIGGTHMGDHKPFDILHTQKRLGFEVKTLLDNKRDAITMHQGSLERKLKAAKDMKLKAAYTVIFDNRPGRDNKIYVTKGLGSFRLFAHGSGNLNPRFSVHNDASTIAGEL